MEGRIEPRSTARTGRLLVLIAAVLWSTSAFFSKSPVFSDWAERDRPVQLTFWRALFATLVLVAFVRRPRLSWRMLPMVVAFAAMNYLFLTAMVHAEAAAAIWLQMTSPAWVFLGSVLIFRERIRRLDWSLLALSLFGVGLIIGFGVRHESPLVLVCGLLSGLMYGCVVLSLRGLRHYDSAWLITLNLGVTALIFAPGVVVRGQLPSVPQLAVVATFGAFQIGLPYLLFAHGVKRIGGHEASGIGLIEPILVPVWVFLAWRHLDDYQAPAWYTLLGGGLILGGLSLRYFAGARRSVRRWLPGRLAGDPLREIQNGGDGG